LATYEDRPHVHRAAAHPEDDDVAVAQLVVGRVLVRMHLATLNVGLRTPARASGRSSGGQDQQRVELLAIRRRA
jgi:hypothetical protein